MLCVCLSVPPLRVRSSCSSRNRTNDRNSLLPYARLYPESVDKQRTNGNLGPAVCYTQRLPHGGSLFLMFFESLLLHHARPFKNLGEGESHQDSWRAVGMSNLHSNSNSHLSFSSLSKTSARTNQDSWQTSGM